MTPYVRVSPFFYGIAWNDDNDDDGDGDDDDDIVQPPK